MSALYHVSPVFKVAVLLDDGDCPVAAEDAGDEFEELERALEWARNAVNVAEQTAPAADGGRWYATIERGHYERDFDSGIDEVDFEWVLGECLDPIYPTVES